MNGLFLRIYMYILQSLYTLIFSKKHVDQRTTQIVNKNEHRTIFVYFRGEAGPF